MWMLMCHWYQVRSTHELIHLVRSRWAVEGRGGSWRAVEGQSRRFPYRSEEQPLD